MPEIDNLSGHFLISPENQGCSFCSNSFISNIKHSNSESLGLVVNKPLDQKMRNNLGIKDDILPTGVKIREFEPIGKGYLLLIHTRDLKETKSLKIGEDFLSEYSSSLFPSSSRSQQIRGDIGFSEWISGQDQSETNTNIWLVTAFDRKIFRYV